MSIPKGSTLVEIKDASGKVVYTALNPTQEDLAAVVPNPQDKQELQGVAENTKKPESMKNGEQSPKMGL